MIVPNVRCSGKLYHMRNSNVAIRVGDVPNVRCSGKLYHHEAVSRSPSRTVCPER